ncbi:MAG: thermonuclease family protein [Bacillota bacterium]
MKIYYKRSVAFIFVFIFLFFSFSVFGEESLDKKSNKELDLLESTVIKRVIDGDTIETIDDETIRILGVDTPEINWDEDTADYYGYKARDFTKEQLLNEKVYLEYDKEKSDDYGRTLAYIYLNNGQLFNNKLLEKGYAHLMIVEPNNKYEKKFKKTAKKAREKKVGIWNRLNQLEEEIPIISWEKAENYYGEEVIVKGEIVNTHQSKEVTYLNFAKNYWETLTIVIFNDDLNKFDYNPAKLLEGKDIRTVGKIKKYEGSAEIIIENPTSLYFY